MFDDEKQSRKFSPLSYIHMFSRLNIKQRNDIDKLPKECRFIQNEYLKGCSVYYLKRVSPIKIYEWSSLLDTYSSLGPVDTFGR